jgi:hypothetical protein
VVKSKKEALLRNKNRFSEIIQADATSANPTYRFPPQHPQTPLPADCEREHCSFARSQERSAVCAILQRKTGSDSRNPPRCRRGKTAGPAAC